MANIESSTSPYTDDQRRAAVIEYAVKGNMRRVSESTGIPHTTLIHWKNSTEWWAQLQAELLAQVEDEILVTNLNVATKSQAELLDRIQNGDVENKVIQGEVVPVRVPVRARDLAIIGSIAQDKARVQLGKPTRIADNTNAMKDLAETFRQLARQNQERVVSEQ